MALDVVIRNGVIVDGSGLASYRGDVGISGDRIVQIGRITEKANKTIDAEGHVVTPGFIDTHAHLDAQMFWDHPGTSSCWHGVTTAIIGNCGFTLAPARSDARGFVLDNFERAEDIPRDAMLAGIDNWTWETFPEYLDAVDAVPKAMNYGAQVGHSPIRTYVMGQRAFDGAASDDDLAMMKKILEEAMYAGAMGFTSSWARGNLTPDGRPVASRFAPTDEIRELVGVLSKLGAGMFQFAGQPYEYGEEICELAIESGVPVAFGVLADAHASERLRFIDSAAARGGRAYGLTSGMGLQVVRSFLTTMPFDGLPGWSEFRSKSIEEQRRLIADPAVRADLIRAASVDFDPNTYIPSKEARPSVHGYVDIEIFDDPTGRGITVAELAQREGRNPVEVMIDLCINSDFKQMFRQTGGSAKDGTLKEELLLELLKHPRCFMSFTDTGAHVSQIVGGSEQSYLLAHWVRDLQALTLEEAVRMISLAPAIAWSVPDRGLLREGMIADINVLDPKTVAPLLPDVVSDLPAGAKRLVQRSTGFLATLVSGKVTLENGDSTGEMSGQLIRGRLASA